MVSMKIPINTIVGFALLISFSSCSKEGVITVVKGNVSDSTRRIKISGYKIVFVKTWRRCANFACGYEMEEVATVYTNNNGDFFIPFNFKLKGGESYTLVEQYYGNPYYPEYTTSVVYTAGTTNFVDINAWKPVEIKLGVEVLNNNEGPLRINVQFNGTKSLNATEWVNEQSAKKTYNFRSKPNSDVSIVFWYYARSNGLLHRKVIPYHTMLNDAATLNYSIDCSTF